MTYSNGSSNSRLSSRAWRIRHSAWMLAVFFGVGVLSFIGFLYVAIRIKTKKWWIVAGATAALSGVGMALMELYTRTDPEGQSQDVPGSADDFAVGYVVILWFGLSIYALIVNRDYLRWKAGPASNAWYRQDPSALQSYPPPQGLPTALPHTAPLGPPSGGPLLDVDSRTYFAPPPEAPTSPAAVETAAVPIDINSADAVTIAAYLGLKPATAERIVAAREGTGGFRTVEDVVAAAGIQPHELVRLRGRVAFRDINSPSSRSARDADAGRSGTPPTSRGGRILDY